jgi:hypothetical protein
MLKFFQRFSPLILAATGLLVLFPAIKIIPSLADDAVLFSAVARASNPLIFFASDWGLDSHMYRPLVSLSYWLVYHLAGVSAAVSQGLNIVLHLACVILFYRLLRELDTEPITAFLFSALTLFSMFTIVAATLAPDRGSLFVGLTLILLLTHKIRRDRAGKNMNPAIVTALCVLALMGKESGAAVLGLAFFLSFYRPAAEHKRDWLIPALTVLTGLGYAALRMAIFGGGYATYGGGSSRLAETAIGFWKALSAVFLPLYSRDPGLEGLLKRMVLVIPTALLWLPFIFRRPTRVQQWCLLVIFMNAVVHAYDFRYRFIYLAQLAVCLFVATAPLMKESFRIRRFVLTVATLVVMYNMYWAAGHIRNERKGRAELVANNLSNFNHLEDPSTVDPAVRAAILRYGVLLNSPSSGGRSSTG